MVVRRGPGENIVGCSRLYGSDEVIEKQVTFVPPLLSARQGDICPERGIVKVVSKGRRVTAERGGSALYDNGNLQQVTFLSEIVLFGHSIKSIAH